MKRILFVLLSAAFVSCSGGRDYNPFGGEIIRVSPEKRAELSGEEVVRLKGDCLDLAGISFVYDSILVMRFVEREEGHFSAYSLNTGECLGDYIYTGRGPKEMLSVRYEGQWESRDDSVWMYLYDLTGQQKFCAFNLTEAVCGDDIVLRSLGKVLPNTLSAYRLNDSTNLFRRITDNRIVYQTADVYGSVSGTWVIYPEVTSNYFSIMTLKSAISPDGGKVASFLVAAPIFDILDLESGEHRSFTHVSDPGFKEDFEHFKSTGLFPPSVNQGYNPKVVGEYILCPQYDDDTIDYLNDGRMLYLFDWDGNLKWELHMKEVVNGFVIDQPNKLLYCPTEEGVIYRYDLSEYVE